MKVKSNTFGQGIVYEAQDLEEQIYVLGCACTSIQSEMLSYANKYPEKFTNLPQFAISIVVLSCQVTDLAILNDLRKLEALMIENPSADYYIGGCLANRFDIELPEGVRRLDTVKEDGYHLDDRSLIDFATPFWVPDFNASNKNQDGHLFRDMYPLRIGVGCAGKCKYCSIRVTRGEPYELDFEQGIKEFLSYDNVVLISDSPSPKQVMDWCEVAIKAHKPISFRNVEPQVANNPEVWIKLEHAASEGVLNILHVPIQHTDRVALKDMGRNVSATLEFIENKYILQKFGVKIATNVIINYKAFFDPDTATLAEFDYVSWNPYWDGKWDRKKAEKRFDKFLPSTPPKWVFISAPYRDADPTVVATRIKAVAEYFLCLKNTGCIPMSPVLVGHQLIECGIVEDDWKTWEKYCNSLLSLCSEVHVLTLPGWDHSAGVQEELRYATTQGIKVVHVAPVATAANENLQ